MHQPQEVDGGKRPPDAVKLLNGRKAELATGHYCPDADEVTFEGFILDHETGPWNSKSMRAVGLEPTT